MTGSPIHRKPNPWLKSMPAFLLFLFVTANFAHANETDFNLVNLMQGLSSAEQSPRHFTEQRHSELLIAPVNLSGTLDYSNGRLIKQIRSPFEETLSIDGDLLTIERDSPAEIQKLRLSDYPPLHTFVMIFRASLQGDLGTLKVHYQTRLSGDSTAWTLHLLPKEASISVYMKKIEIEGSQNQINRFTITEPNGDHTILQLGKAIQ